MTAELATPAGPARLCAAIPGRERWRVPGLQGDRALAARLVLVFDARDDVVAVSASPITGRLLVQYARDVPSDVFRRHLQSALRQAAAGPAEVASGADRGQAALTLAGAGSALIVLAFVGGASAMIGLALLGGGFGLTWLAQGDMPRLPAAIEQSISYRVLLYAREDWRDLATGAALTLLSVAFSLSRFMVIGGAIDMVAAPPARRSVAALGGYGLLLTALQAACDYAGRVAWTRVARRTQERIRIAAYAHVQLLDMLYIERQGSSRLAATLIQDVEQVGAMFDAGHEMLRTAANGALVGAFFLLFVPRLALVAIAPIPLILLGANRLERRLTPKLRQAGAQLSLMNARIAAGLEGVATVRAFAAEARDSAAIRQRSDDLRGMMVTADRTASLASPMIEILIMGGTLLTLVSARRLVADGTLSPGGYASTMMLTGQFLWPVAAMGQVLERHRKAAVAVGRIFDLMAVPVAPLPGRRSLRATKVLGDIRFERVRFGYDPGSEVLRQIDLDFPPGRTVALVGATGCGKSTIAKLLLRLYPPRSGKITIDGLAIQQIKPHDLRTAIGFVSQDVFLFDGTILDNIRFADPDVGIARVEQACRTVELLDFIGTLPAGFDTPIGERGVRLSGGQRQRLAIARAILRRPPVLILDEATSALDHRTEAAVQHNLATEFADRTLIVIAHRLSTIRDVDHIVYLEDGRVVEQGSDAELRALDGRYAAALRFARMGAGASDDRMMPD